MPSGLPSARLRPKRGPVPSSSHPARTAQNPQEEIRRLREPVDGLQRERRVGERDTDEDFTLAAELRWRINQLQRDKLDCCSKHNQEVSRYEAQAARLRALVERGEAQRQNLEYELTVVKRDTEELRTHNTRLEVLSSELRQRVSDLQRSLEITQQAREDELQGLQAELRERDRLMLSSAAEHELLQAEKTHLDTLIQEQNETLYKLKCEVERVKRDGEKDTERLKHQSTELKRSVEREQKLRCDLEMRMRDLEGALELEKKGHAEVMSSLELMKQKFGEVERANADERDRSHDLSHKLSQLEKDFLTMRTDLIGQLEHEKAESVDLISQLEHVKAESADLIGQLEQERAESVKLSVKLQEQERVCSETQQEHMRVQASYDSVLSDLDQVVHQYQQQGATHTYNTEGYKHNASALMDILQRTLHNYSTQSQESVVVLQKLDGEIRQKDEVISDLQMKLQECEARGVCVHEEAKRLRACVSDAAVELRRLSQQLQEEKTQHTHTHAQINTLRQQHHSDGQEKLAFLHTLYQRMLAGCVLVTPPHCMLGSFSWAELSALVQEHMDTLTSDLAAANQKVSCLESVCEGKSAALESVSAQMRQREERWVKLREDLDTRHTHLNQQLQLKVQELSVQLERAQSEQRQEVMRLCVACGLLAGCVRALRRQVCLLAWQKLVLLERVSDADAMKTEVAKLLQALGEPGVKGHGRFRRYAIAVLAAGRLRALGRGSGVMFRVAVGVGPHVCVREEEEDGVKKTLTSAALIELVHTCVGEVQEDVNRTSSAAVMSAAQSGCRKMLERLLWDVDSQCAGHYGKDSLARRLRDGLHAQNTKHSSWNSKMMMASLQKHILEFTQRLHSAEVERRNLRLERTHTHTGRDTHTACAPRRQLERVCEELSCALQRELRAQALLHDQASQLQQLGLSMELHTGDELEKDRTLAQAVQSLSDAKLELRRTHQSLRSLGKRLSQSQQDNQELQRNIISAENTLHTAEKNKESLMSFMKCVEERLKEMKVLLSGNAPSQDDFFLQLSRVCLMPADSQSIMGNPERDACQRLVMRFLELFQLIRCKMSPQRPSSSCECDASCVPPREHS
ncbi:coiled-coil domain-containing protein 171 isoform X2 [Pimephales promelas]|uniref:coiled-coil domain-containing protein 171 isoform X2 n=1 Tax=Pimephales promelas TaxID=90988 RepID=UPI001955E285|nr:coiled-coil domain-containing protein 171 isoform X2 [Pimephales promelas]